MLLAVAAEQKEQLRLESIPLSIHIEIRQKRILLEFLKQHTSLKGWLEKTRQRGFSNPYSSLNDDEKPLAHQSFLNPIIS